MVKRVVLGLGVIILGIYLFSGFMGLSGYSNSVEETGVYATGQGLNGVFDNCFCHGFAYEIFKITPEIFYSYDSNGEVIGEFFETKTEDFNLSSFAQKLGLVGISSGFVNSTFNIYCKTNLLPYRVPGKEFNVQICVAGEKTIVASPIIMGSF